MESISRLVLYKEQIERLMNESQNAYRLLVLEMLRINCILLENIEPYFVSKEMSTEVDVEAEYSLLMETYRHNLRFAEHYWRSRQLTLYVSSRILWRQLDTAVDRLFSELRKVPEGKRRGNAKTRTRTLFNRLIRTLATFSEKLLDSGNSRYFARSDGTAKMAQVFLSHAFEDRLYTWVLYEYFLDRGIFLYVDWMHNTKKRDGAILKQILSQEIAKSKQLLFLRTPNSELNLQGSQYVRPWCSWEVGNFYSVAPNEKYVIDLYATKKLSSNLQLHGMNLLQSVSAGKLYGRPISYSTK